MSQPKPEERPDIQKIVSKHIPSALKTWLTSLLLFVAAWIGIGLLTWVMTANGLGHWIELFNGATWPSQFVVREPNSAASTPAKGVSDTGAEAVTPQAGGKVPDNPHGFFFFLVLSLRTVLNLGVVLTAALILFVVATKRGKDWLMSRLASMLVSRDAALAAYLVMKMREKGKPLSPEAQMALYSAAAEFASSEAGRIFLDEFLNNQKKAVHELVNQGQVGGAGV